MDNYTASDAEATTNISTTMAYMATLTTFDVEHMTIDNSSSGPSGDQTLSPEMILGMMNKTQFQILTPSFILASVLLVIGLPGNLLAFVVYLTKMKRNTASYFIMALTLSDLINCVFSLPVELYLIANFWTFDHPVLCKLSRFLTASMNNTSSFVLVVIAVERFRSICTPLKPRFTSKFSKILCVSIFTAAGVSALPMIWGYGTFTYTVVIQNVTASAKTCLIDDSVKSTAYPDGLLIYFFVGHIIVFLILATLYSCIARKLIGGNRRESVNKSKPHSEHSLLERKPSSLSVMSSSVRCNGHLTPTSDKDFNPNAFSASRISLSSVSTFKNYLTRKHGGQNFRTRRLTCMLFLMTSVFEISFIPYLVIVTIRNQNPSLYGSLNVTGKMAYQFFLRFYLINCALNPIIYCFYNQNFRQGVHLLFKSIKDSFCKKR